jgi:LacI family repressor for deo operon, udp, cdd, tsx, nupC, and nupG
VANIKDIAKLAGVSTATVSRTLAMPDVVAPETRARVEAAVRKLDYKPNALASSLRRRRTENIVVVVPDIHNPFFSGVVQGIEHVAHGHGHKVLLGESQNNQQRLDSYAAMLGSKEADGLILLGALLPTSIERAVAAGEPPPAPIVMACEYFAGLQAPNVRIDNVAAAAAATEHLLQLGHRRIAMITGPSGNPLVKDRVKGYRQQMAKAEIAVPADYVARGDFTLESGYHAMQKLFALSHKPTAVFCANDEMAMGAIRAAKEAGKRVPQELSVVGFDDIRFAEYYDPPLTTIRQPQREIGETAMRLILDVFAKRNAPTSVVLPHALVIRGSTKALR